MTLVRDDALILILLPVYNGARFLPAQLDSILRQSYPHWQLICRDDGSSDASPAIIADFQRRYPEKVFIVQDGDGNLGAAGSFARLMAQALARDEARGKAADCTGSMKEMAQPTYVALADQDDVWHEEKLALTLQAMRAGEARRPDMPMLVHTDLQVTDEHGSLLSPSLMSFQGLRPARRDFESQVAISTVTGCTTLINMPLLRAALPVPPEAIMHDWWLSLVASAFGELVFVDQPLVAYRQHSNNTIGARQHEKLRWDGRLLMRIFRRRDATAQALFEDSARQAAAFEARFADRLTSAQRRRIRQVMQLPQWSLWRQRFWFHVCR